MISTRTKLFLACLAGALPASAAGGERWFDDALAESGKAVYETHCAACHGEAAAGTGDWQQRGPDGAYPAPPLNGTAHAWHHNLEVLRRQIREGGKKLGGVMPAFAGTLDEAEIAAVIAYFQSLWSDDIYATWASSYPEDAAAGMPAASTGGGATGDITGRLRSLLSPNTEIGEPEATPIEGIYGVRAGGRYLYVDETGRFLFTGELMDLEARENLTETSMGAVRRDLLESFPAEDMVVYPAEGDEKASLKVFTDTTCPFCRRLHQEVPELQAAGVAVRYLPFPRSGPDGPGADEMRSVWCETDRAAAMTEAKSGEGYIVGDTSCEAAAAIAEGYELGIAVGVTGTPAIILPDGRMIAGYQPVPNLLRALGVSRP